MELELIERERKAAERRLKAARFPTTKMLDEFDFVSRPSVHKPQVLELVKGEYLDRRENILLVGPSGTGKTHLATAFGMAACSHGRKVRFFRVTELVTLLLEAKEERHLLRMRQQLAKLDLLGTVLLPSSRRHRKSPYPQGSRPSYPLDQDFQGRPAPSAHEPLIRSNIVAEAPLAGLSFPSCEEVLQPPGLWPEDFGDKEMVMNRSSMKQATLVVGLSVGTGLLSAATSTADTFVPYEATTVPQTVSALWQNYDARKEPLDVEAVQEWKTDGIVSRYVLFTVGTFKGTPARMAAYYTFPDDGQKHPAFVWSHGGGQRAERSRGVFFARQGYATVDINWLGRPCENEIDANTDWGKVDPTQGPQFYSKALRQSWKLNLQPDEHTIDPVASPRNSNWFLLSVAGRRAITFLEQQPEVDAERIGFAGYSMGGMITALTAIDSRLKAVVPFVGGTGFTDVDFPDVEGSSLRLHLKDPDLYRRTIDASGYWPLVRCPVCFISSSNDFHAAFDRIYRSMTLLKHPHWRVSTNIHQNHGPGPEQWVLLTMWFDQYLKGSEQRIPVTPPSTMVVSATQASFSVTPADQNRLVATEVYFSYDPNPLTRFWNRADATQSGGTWSVDLPMHEDLPLYAFAICRYRLPEARQLERGETSTFVLNSLEQSHLPPAVRRAALANLATKNTLFEDFRRGVGDWSSRDGSSITTYKFQNPAIERSNDKKLVFTIDPRGKSLMLQLQTDSKFLGRADNQGSFTVSRPVRGESPQRIVISREDFKGPEGEKLEWAKIATFQVTLVNLQDRAKIPLAAADGQVYLQAIELVD